MIQGIDNYKDTEYTLLYSVSIPNYAEKILTANARKTKYKINSKGITVVANPRTAGKPRYWVINNQPIYSGNLNPHIRAAYIGKIKDVYTPYFKHLPKMSGKLTILIRCINCTSNTDFDNFVGLFKKCLLDLLVKRLECIQDDTREFVVGFFDQYFEDDELEGTKMEVQFYQTNY